MARIPSIKRLVVEDFADQKSWIGKLFLILNQFLGVTVAALNRGITVNDNMAAQTTVLNIDLSQPIPYPVSFLNTIPGQPRIVGVTIWNVTENSGSPATITNATSLAWTYSGNQISIQNVAGLTTGKKYFLTVACYSG